MTDTVHLVFGYVFGVLLQNLVAIFFCNHHLHLFALFGQQQKKGVKVLSNSILRVPEKQVGKGGLFSPEFSPFSPSSLFFAFFEPFLKPIRTHGFCRFSPLLARILPVNKVVFLALFSAPF